MLNTIALRAVLTRDGSCSRPGTAYGFPQGESQADFGKKWVKKKKGKKEPRFCPFFPHADLPEPTLNLALGSAGLLLLS
jgi:hypothetical protein